MTVKALFYPIASESLSGALPVEADVAGWEQDSQGPISILLMYDVEGKPGVVEGRNLTIGISSQAMQRLYDGFNNSAAFLKLTPDGVREIERFFGGPQPEMPS